MNQKRILLQVLLVIGLITGWIYLKNRFDPAFDGEKIYLMLTILSIVLIADAKKIFK